MGLSFSGDKLRGSNLSKAGQLVLPELGGGGCLMEQSHEQTDGIQRENLCLNSAGMWIKPLN